MKRGWLLYDDPDLAVNQDFAAFVTEQARERGMAIETVRRSELTFGIRENGSFVRRGASDALPDFVISRQRDALLSRQFERLGVPVFNNARACELCNDKRLTHQLLAGEVAMLPTEYVDPRYASAPRTYPAVVKPACSHGGDRVTLVRDERQWREAVASIAPAPMLTQRVASEAGKDLRVYVLFGEIIAGVLRTAQEGIVSNYKRGGDVTLHPLTADERALTRRVIDVFSRTQAPLCFAGVDMLYHQGKPVLGEVEDVVGSRMLYKVGGPNIVGLYLDGVASRMR